jgi:hypothetical protein
MGMWMQIWVCTLHCIACDKIISVTTLVSALHLMADSKV